jgi:hypothetical protein
MTRVILMCVFVLILGLGACTPAAVSVALPAPITVGQVTIPAGTSVSVSTDNAGKVTVSVTYGGQNFVLPGTVLTTPTTAAETSVTRNAKGELVELTIKGTNKKVVINKVTP